MVDNLSDRLYDGGMIKVYRYGLRRPVEGDQEVRTQMRLAHRYRNTLVEIEHARRDAVRAFRMAHGDIQQLTLEVQKEDAVVYAAVQAAKAAKMEARSAAAPEHLREAVVVAKAAKKAALDRLRQARKTVKEDPDAVKQLDLIEERAADLRRNARAHCGVYWGTYLLIEDADVQARAVPYYDISGTGPNNPGFSRWCGEGMIGVQTQGGLGVADAFGDDTMMRIEPGTLPKGADPLSKRSARRKFTVLALRIGSDGRAPRWARFPMLMHRPLPTDGIIKRVAVALRKIGPREEWVATLTVESADVQGMPFSAKGMVGIDLGWRLLERDGAKHLRVAAWHDTDDRHGELVLDQWTMSGLMKADELRSVRDDNFNDARVALKEHLVALVVPQWMQVATVTLMQWRAIARLTALVHRWKKNRFQGDDVAYEALEAWRYHDHHLWQWETSQRTGAGRARREAYRVFASRLAKAYEKVVLEGFDLRRVARLLSVEEATKAENLTARHMRTLAAVSELRSCIEQAFGLRRHWATQSRPGNFGRVVVVAAKDTTKTCFQCGSIEQWDQANELRHTCSKCGSSWDQDQNAAKNILLRERSGGAMDDGGARTDGNQNDSGAADESRWQRARRMKREKDRRK